MVKPVFVVGSSRSGTTMVGRVLNQHPSVRTFPELHFFEQMCDSESLGRELSIDDATALMDRLIGTMENGFLHYRHGGQYLEQARKWVQDMSGVLTAHEVYLAFLGHYAISVGAAYACDQTPRNVYYISDILRAYPDARIIAMVRDPRAVLISQKNKWKRKFLGASRIPFRESLRSYINYHPYTITRLWAASLSAAERYREDSRVMLIKYEDIVTKPEEVIGSMCRFLGLPYTNKMLEVPYVGSSSGHDAKNTGLGLSTKSVRTSFDDMLTQGELYICEKVAMPYMQEYGYKISNVKRLPIVQLTLYAILFPVKMSIAIIFNLKRMKNIREAIMRRTIIEKKA